jgi:hypothetical protein
MKKTRRRVQQEELRFHRRGGARKGAGRKPKGDRAGVSHARRLPITRHTPVHVTLKVARHVYNLRTRRCFDVVEHGLRAARVREGFRIVRFAVLRDHIHLLVEARDASYLARGVQGLAVRLARGWNRVMQRKGRVFADRYHAHRLTTPNEVRNALPYVADNYARHEARSGRNVGERFVDAYSSAGRADLVSPEESWLLRTGWRLVGRMARVV